MKKKLTSEAVLYCREHYVAGDKEFGLRGLAAKLGVNVEVIKGVVHGLTYKDVGGKIHPARERLTAEAKIAIANGEDLQTLTARFGISEETVQKYLGLLQPKKKPKKSIEVPDFLKEALIEAFDMEKLSVKALAERFSISREVVKNVLSEAGISLRQRVDDDTKQEIVEAYKAGQSLRELEEIYGVNRATIADWIRPFKREKPKIELTQELRERIYRYHSQGYGIGIIAKTLGISQQTVRRIIDGEL